MTVPPSTTSAPTTPWRKPRGEAASPRITILVGAVVALFALWFPRSGLFTYFTGDDLMNIHHAVHRSYWETLLGNLTYFTSEDRPFGTLVYRVLFDLGGLNAPLFRLVCFGLMLFNLFLLYKTAVVIGGREAGVLTALFAAYNAGLADLYLNSGTIYDLLCFAFYLSALWVYANARTRRVMPWVLVLYILALNSKETAATLPLILLGYESIVARAGERPRWRWGWALAMLALTVPYAIGKLSGNLMENDAYRLHLGVRTYFRAMAHYLTVLTVPAPFSLNAAEAGLLLFAAGILAIVSRRPALRFAWFVIVVTALPVAFIALRGGYAMYLAYFGIALFLGALVVEIRNTVSQWIAGPDSALSGETRRLLQAGTVAWFILALLLFHYTRPLAVVSAEDRTLRLAAGQLEKLRPYIDPKGEVLFLDDPFHTDSPSLAHLLRLQHRAPNLTVHRVKQMPLKPDAAQMETYESVLTFQGSDLIPIRPVK